jgi:hypothetical protein
VYFRKPYGYIYCLITKRILSNNISMQCTRGVTFLLCPGVGMLEHPGHASCSLRDGAAVTWLCQIPLNATWRAPIGPHVVPGQVAVEGSHRRSQPILLCITCFLYYPSCLLMLLFWFYSWCSSLQSYFFKFLLLHRDEEVYARPNQFLV